MKIHGKYRPVTEDAPRPENMVQMSADVDSAPVFDEYERSPGNAFTDIYGDPIEGELWHL